MRRTAGVEILFMETRIFNKIDKNFHLKGLWTFVITELLKWRAFWKGEFCKNEKHFDIKFHTFIEKYKNNLLEKY
jgi:hypothetical protein